MRILGMVGLVFLFMLTGCQASEAPETGGSACASTPEQLIEEIRALRPNERIEDADRLVELIHIENDRQRDYVMAEVTYRIPMSLAMYERASVLWPSEGQTRFSAFHDVVNVRPESLRPSDVAGRFECDFPGLGFNRDIARTAHLVEVDGCWKLSGYTFEYYTDTFGDDASRAMWKRMHDPASRSAYLSIAERIRNGELRTEAAIQAEWDRVPPTE